MNPQSIILIYSGGLDSTVLLAKLLHEGHSVKALSINYGQRHRRELDSAIAICDKLGVEHKIADLTSLKPLLAGSSQTDDSVPVPHGHYAAENMKVTVVPNRNMLMLAVAGAWAIATKANSIGYAAHAGDHQIYPDCREEFVGPLAVVLRNADWHPVDIERSFLKMTKADIVRVGHSISADNLMSMSYSCYEGKELHCALCGTCQERRSAFRDAGVADHTAYNQAGLEQLPDEKLTS